MLGLDVEYTGRLRSSRLIGMVRLHLSQDQPALTSTIRRLARLLRLSITHLRGEEG